MDVDIWNASLRGCSHKGTEQQHGQDFKKIHGEAGEYQVIVVEIALMQIVVERHTNAMGGMFKNLVL